MDSGSRHLDELILKQLGLEEDSNTLGTPGEKMAAEEQERIRHLTRRLAVTPRLCRAPCRPASPGSLTAGPPRPSGPRFWSRWASYSPRPLAWRGSFSFREHRVPWLHPPAPQISTLFESERVQKISSPNLSSLKLGGVGERRGERVCS